MCDRACRVQFDWDFANRERMIAQGRMNNLLPHQDNEEAKYKLICTCCAR